MIPIQHIEYVYYSLASAAILFYPVHYVWKWFRRVDNAVSNEIPHMHAYLLLICKKLGIDVIDLGEPKK